jgi:PAS domain S-box-containing protein
MRRVLDRMPGDTRRDNARLVSCAGLVEAAQQALHDLAVEASAVVVGQSPEAQVQRRGKSKGQLLPDRCRLHATNVPPDRSHRGDQPGSTSERLDSRAVSDERQPTPLGLSGDLTGALENLQVPSYAYDRHGVIRWLNPAARELLGDVRGKQYTTPVAPEQKPEARESFARKMLGNERASEHKALLVNAQGKRIAVELHSAPLRDGHKVVGVFGVFSPSTKAPPPPHPKLTPRQNQILHLLARGYSTGQIADELHLTTETVRNHIRRMLRSLGAHSRLEALARARSDGLLAD